MSILVIGDANTDLSAAMRRFPHEGEDAAISSLHWESGGAGVNVAAGLAGLGTPARLVARVGGDPAAAIALRGAQRAGADLTFVQRDPATATGICIAAISPGGERTFLSFRGANVACSVPPDQDALFDGIRWVHVCGHALLEGQQRQSTLALIEAAAQRDLPISLDLCLPLLEHWHADTHERLPHLQIIFANQRELAALYPQHAHEQALQQAASAANLIVVKLGAAGCVALEQGTWHDYPTFPINAVDSTGCGDAFVAGYLHATLARRSLAEAAISGNLLGALCATRTGAAEALPSSDEVQAFLTQYPQHELLHWLRVEP